MRIIKPFRNALVGIYAAGAFLALAGCSSSASEDKPAPTGTVVTATLTEWAIAVDRATAPPGPVTFKAVNAGKELHEFVVMKTDLAIDKMPTLPSGAIDEEGAGVANVGEIGDLPAGTTDELKLDMAAGKYVLICNIVEDPDAGMGMDSGMGGDAGPSHFVDGMKVAFEVK